MDLYAFAQISNYEDILKEKGINIPRLRGIRKMSEEKLCPREEILNTCKEYDVHVLKDLIESNWGKLNYFVYDDFTSYCEKYYIKDGNIDWNKIHGKKRKKLKYEIRKNYKKILKSFETFNKYVGRDDVLYIHARLGSGNWTYYDCPNSIENQDWFLEKVDDYYDSTYCDIYVQV